MRTALLPSKVILEACQHRRVRETQRFSKRLRSGQKVGGPQVAQSEVRKELNGGEELYQRLLMEDELAGD
jgi:hypothetical protein